MAFTLNVMTNQSARAVCDIACAVCADIIIQADTMTDTVVLKNPFVELLLLFMSLALFLALHYCFCTCCGRCNNSDVLVDTVTAHRDVDAANSTHNARHAKARMLPNKFN